MVTPAQDTVAWSDAPVRSRRRSRRRCYNAGSNASASTAPPCHSELGDGHGMIVQRGFPAPPSYHIDRLRNAPTQHFYDVITNGYGAMYSFAGRVSPRIAGPLPPISGRCSFRSIPRPISFSRPCDDGRPRLPGSPVPWAFSAQS